jgi:methenyltetrahydrofolate cyclohydrolase
MTDATQLVDHSIAAFTDRLAAAAPVPGGGSASALGGATAAGLVAMVAALSQGPKADEDSARTAHEIEQAAAAPRRELLALVERDAAAYAGVVEARRLPRGTVRERELRAERLARAMTDATAVPLRTAERVAEILGLAERLLPAANRNAVSDLGVAAHLGSAALHGALLNVRVNLPSLPASSALRAEAEAVLAPLAKRAAERSSAILDGVERRMTEAVG